MAGASLILLARTAAITGYVYLICFTGVADKADATVRVMRDKAQAQWCTWDTHDCEVADMVVMESPSAGEWTVYISRDRRVCR